MGACDKPWLDTEKTCLELRPNRVIGRAGQCLRDTEEFRTPTLPATVVMDGKRTRVGQPGPQRLVCFHANGSLEWTGSAEERDFDQERLEVRSYAEN